MRDEAFVLHLRRAEPGAVPPQRSHHEFRAELGEPVVEFTCGLARIDRRLEGVEDDARIHAGRDRDDAETGRRLARHEHRWIGAAPR